jgi:YfiH family protein
MTTGTEEFFIQPDWPAPTNIKAYSTLRTSKIGERESVDAPINRSRLKSLLELPGEPAWLTQKHTNVVIRAAASSDEPEADASFSDTPGRICAVLTADCLPILICNRNATHVAAIHAGWRGLASGIIDTTLQAMGLPAEDLLVWLGPAIGPTCFEVRKDVYDIFTQQNEEDAVAFTQFAPDHWLADIYGLARRRLQKHGIGQIFGGNFCTYSDQKRFFSYRREGKLTGRIISLIWIDDAENQ